MLPVKLKKADLDKTTLTYNYQLSYSGEDIVSNLTLREKLKEEYNLVLPEFEDEMTPEEYFESLKPLINSVPNTKLVREFALEILSFSKMQMFLDLDNDRWPSKKGISTHPIISTFLGDTSSKNINLEENTSDAKEIYISMDADESQYKAIKEIQKGKNLVIEGPPGTGKSQTISNIIATAINDNKTILFVAEKLAALEVVKKRLDDIGLGKFCLDLHSHRAHKQKLMKDIESRLDESFDLPEDTEFTAKELQESKKELDIYAELIATEHKNSSLSYHEIFWEAEKNRFENIEIPYLVNAKMLTKYDLQDIEEALVTIDSFIHENPDILSSPWYGFESIKVGNLDIEKLLELWENYIEYYDTLIDISRYHKNTIGLNIETVESLQELKKIIPDFSLDNTSIDNGIQVVSAYGHLEYLKLCEQINDCISELEKEETLNYKNIKSRDDLEYMINVIDEYSTSGIFKKIFSIKYRKAKKMMFSISAKSKNSLSYTLKAIKSAKSTIDKLIQLYKNVVQTECKQIDEYLGIKELNNHFIDDIDTIINNLEKLYSLRPVAQWLHDIDRVYEISSTTKQYIKSNLAENVIDKMNDLMLHSSDLTEKIDLTCIAIQEFGVLNKSKFYGSNPNSLDVIERKHDSLKVKLDSLRTWIDYNIITDVLHSYDLDWILERLRKYRVSSSELVNLFRYSFYDSLSKDIIKENSEFSLFSRQKHEQAIKNFIALDKKALELNRKISAYNASLIETVEGISTGKIADLSEMGLIKNEIRKKTRHVSVRSLLKRAPKSMQALKPCFMMSPMSCAQYLGPGKIEFDLLIIDEASQIKPEDSFGAIARAKQVVVVGDSNQLPPTNFFQRTHDLDDDATIVDEAESILDVCSQSFSNSKRLQWHYRSKHQDLIAFSNQYFYDNDLVLFPSRNFNSEELGVKNHYISSAQFINGKNTKEADYVVNAIIHHITNNPKESLGVVAMNIKQADLIENLFEEKIKENHSLDKILNAFNENKDSFFIKNLENVQGDERDVIFISTTYGKDEDGKQHQRFGPINSSNGWRRLNVVITRAKKRVEVFTSMKSSDIEVNENSSRGHIALKDYLKYSETGYLKSEATEVSVKNNNISAFQESIAKILNKNGYEVDIQVGSAGYFIDIGVKHPDQKNSYILAIECDGPNYFNAKRTTDRDRLRREVLIRGGWEIHRIWSVDWFIHRKSEIKRLLEKIESARYSK